jgi:Acyl-CoA reductase (LuxC)
VTHLNKLVNELGAKVIFGTFKNSVNPHVFFNERTIDFFDRVSQMILSDQSIRQYSDLISFGYWCRRSNLDKIKGSYGNRQTRVGLGETFHIAPSNVPINFAYSTAFALLAGNTCTVRVPTRDYFQVEKLCKIFEYVTNDQIFQEFRDRIRVIQYVHSDEITEFFSRMANARLIWGGDKTIDHIRKIPSSLRNIDLTFSDRYSLAIFSARFISQLSEKELKKFSQLFYNDVYLFDQNACSSPRLIVWWGEGADISEAQNIFWRAVGSIVLQQYPQEASHTSTKLLELCKIAISDLPTVDWQRDTNNIEHIYLGGLTREIFDIENRFGMFFEYSLTDFNELSDLIDPKIQTITYGGFAKHHIANLLPKLFLTGVDRIVPVGQALNMGPIWDGYDVPLMLSRIIDLG